MTGGRSGHMAAVTKAGPVKVNESIFAKPAAAVAERVITWVPALRFRAAVSSRHSAQPPEGMKSRFLLCSALVRTPGRAVVLPLA